MNKKIDCISGSQLVCKLKRDKKIDFLALVTSSWHYLSALSTIVWLKKKKNVRKGIILINEHPRNGWIISPNLLEISSNKEIEILAVKDIMLAASADVRKYLFDHLKEGSAFYIMRPVMPKLEFSVYLYNSNIRKNIVHITLEEGLGVYMRDWKAWASEELSESDSLGLWKQFKMRTIDKYLSEALLRKRGELIVNTLFTKKHGRLLKNNTSIHYIDHTLRNLSNSYDFSHYDFYRNSIIICTQPYGEQNKIYNNADIRIIEGLCKKVNKKNIKVVIKPHPREKNLDKYERIGAILDAKNDVPLELILTGMKPKCIVGITTTTLVTAQLLWDIPTISLARVINKSNYAKETAREIENFCKKFSDIVQIPDNILNIYDYQ